MSLMVNSELKLEIFREKIKNVFVMFHCRKADWMSKKTERQQGHSDDGTGQFSGVLFHMFSNLITVTL